MLLPSNSKIPSCHVAPLPDGILAVDVLRAFAPQIAFVWHAADRDIGSFGYRRGRFTTVVLRHNDQRDETQRGAHSSEDPFQFLEDLHRTTFLATPSREHIAATLEISITELPELIGGVYGVVAYEAGRFSEPKLNFLSPREGEPDLSWGVASELLVIDHFRNVIWSISWSHAKEAEELLGHISQLKPERTAQQGNNEKSIPAGERLSKAQFIEMVGRAQEYIRAGDAYQIVLSNEYTASGSFDPVAAFARQFTDNISAYQFLAKLSDETYLLGATPETMLATKRLSDGRQQLLIRPVKGTYPRYRSPDELLADEKERAEHLMLVDHERNDLGKIAVLGSVQAERLFQVESYEHLHHLISDVTAILKPELTVFDALRACFPIATLCGTPRIRAMEIVRELEQIPRGYFGGAVVFVNHEGDLRSCVTIRSALVDRHRLQLAAGAGIVFDSVAEREYTECQLKARSTLQSFGVVL